MTNAERIRSLNDAFRKSFVGGRIVITSGISSRKDVEVIVNAVKCFDGFDSDNDPHCENDFGGLEIGADTVFWKIDYYDISLQAGSADPTDPTDPNITTRVLTILLAEEY